MMKKIVFIASLMLLFFFSTPIVESPFVELNPPISYYRIEQGIEPEFTVEAITHSCYVPSWTECPDGYECWNCCGFNGINLYTYGKKVGWDCKCLISDPGPHTYKWRMRYQIVLDDDFTITSKALFNGDYEIQLLHVASPKLDFGTPTSPLYWDSELDKQWDRVDNTTVYSPSLGYGWEDITGLDSNYSDCRHVNALVDDFVLSTSDHTFNIDVENGEYRVTLIFEDNCGLHDYIDVSAEGILEIDDLTLTYPNKSTEISFNVTVNDGQLNLMFHDDGGTDPYWIINGIVWKNIDPVTEIVPGSMSTSLDFNYSDPRPYYLFEPSYVYGEDVGYPNCGVMWLNFSQTDQVMICTPIKHKMYTVDLNNTDLNEDGWTDIYDAIILSNEFGQSWGSPGDPVDPNDDTWRADINSNGGVDVGDYSMLKNQFDTEYIAPKENINILQPEWDPPRCGLDDCYSGNCW